MTSVCLVAHPVDFGSASMLRYEAALSTMLTELGYSLRLCRAPRVFRRFSTSGTPSKWLVYLDSQVVLPVRLLFDVLGPRGRSTLYVFADHSLGLPVAVGSLRKHFVHCHDFLAQKAALGRIDGVSVSLSGRLYQFIIRKSVRRARSFVCVSSQTSRDLVSLLGSASDRARILVVPNAVSPAFRRLGVSQARAELSMAGLRVDPGFILNVGSNDFYKNRTGLLRLYADYCRRVAAPLPLILVGPAPLPEMLPLIRRAEGFSGRVVLISGIPDDALAALYSLAYVLVFPSVGEGFGWPLAEALACGCPVLTSPDEPMSEVCGDQAIYFDHMPRVDDESWLEHACQQLARLCDSPDLSESAVVTRVEQARRFAVSQVRSQLHATYEAEIAEGAS